ncbi:hypothetical protein J7T55_011881 [Diaporthe amygdali]|uniref:uncharacterized protein n=1 Tax=Phomopsis amygdali TaxID=1214568 RepID=UPI0022FECF14|nr:uncharacterized protein J7T55_011881 [Diaporthe amygdali]KAJ0123416.1 hypothetical protein J7T55_011881 [Diaporthe amygdali]
MGGWATFLLTYLFGGVTFLPLVVLTVFLHAHFTLPRRQDADPSRDTGADDLVQPSDDLGPLQAAQKESKEQAKAKATGHHETETAAGYFAVCREYTPMGINAKPIERSTPVGSTTVAAPSQSVYQTMYRSIFDRKQNPGPLDNGKSVSLRPKKAGNVFYVVLRHGHLMLFDDDEQLEVRHVISLTHHDVSIYSGGDVTPEGELFIKRNAICLSRRINETAELTPDSQISKPFYLFSENCSAKEDFYFALLRNQEQAFPSGERAAPPLSFDVKNVISLVQKLHSSEEHLQSRWLNAMLGRLFLGLYKTADIEAFIREKLTKKISRVKRPAFLSSIEIRKIDPGESAPYFTNLRHKDLTVEGECSMEADVKYTGNFRIEVAAVARLDLGTRLKAREVNLVLSVALRKMEGHLIFKIKPPPSNRVWFTFSQVPKMEMTIEPIVSSRQITYTVILRQIEARIKEVVAETLVLPFWDDTPFFKTEHKRWRGGIFQGDDAVEPSLDSETAAAQIGEVDDVETLDTGTPPNYELPPMEKSQSMPVIEPVQTSPSTSLFGLKLGRGSKIPQTNPSSPTIDVIEPKHVKVDASSTSVDVKKETHAKQRPVRSGSFVGEPTPIVSTDTVNADVFKPSSPPGESPAASAMARLSSRSKAASGSGSPLTSPHRNSIVSIASAQSNASSKDHTDKESEQDETPKLPRRGTASSTHSNTGDGSSGTGGSPTPSVKSSKTNTGSLTRGLFLKRENTTDSASTTATTNSNTESAKRIPTSLAAVSSAAGAARRWGLNALQRHANDQVKNGQGAEGEPQLDLSKPMGGGRPLPPPGIPLPMPDKKTKTAIPVPRRKPVPAPPLPERPPADAKGQDAKRRPVPPPPLPKRRRRTDEEMHGQGEDMLVVEAPIADSEPTSPLPDEAEAYRHPYVEDADEDLDPFVMDDGSPEEGSSGTPPAKPSEESQLSFGTSNTQGESATDDEYEAWMENTGEDEPPPEYVTSEGLTH